MTKSVTELDADVRAISAFGSLDEMTADMKRTGYVPTLRTDDNMAREPEEKARVRRVVDACLAAGLRVYAPLEGSEQCVLQGGPTKKAAR